MKKDLRMNGDKNYVVNVSIVWGECYIGIYSMSWILVWFFNKLVIEFL